MKFEEKQLCPRCHGSGKVDIVNPHLMREARLAAGISLRTVAKRLKVTPPYISDVELGRRNVTAKILKFYEGLHT